MLLRVTCDVAWCSLHAIGQHATPPVPTRPHTYARRCIPRDPPRCRANIDHCVRTAHALPGEARVNDRGQPASNFFETVKHTERAVTPTRVLRAGPTHAVPSPEHFEPIYVVHSPEHSRFSSSPELALDHGVFEQTLPPPSDNIKLHPSAVVFVAALRSDSAATSILSLTRHRATTASVSIEHREIIGPHL